MSEDFIGQTIGGYIIEAAVGRGGMATVYLARQTSMNRTVALKILPRDQMKDEAYLKRFEREVAIVAQLEHRAIVPVYDHGEHEGQPFIAMRYMSGGSLDAYLQNGALPQERVLAIFEQIAPALDYAHTKGVLHRDLKPSNVLLDDAGGAYITDFGIARVFGDGVTTEVTITQHGVVGTPAYMSPEQAQGKPLDGRSDVYSLGVVLFELLAGQRPFQADAPYSIAVMQVTTEPPSPRRFNPSLALSVEHVILKALRKRPEERFQTATELTEALRMAVENPAGFNPHDTQPNRRPLAAATQPVHVHPAPMPQFSAPPVQHTATPPTPVSAMRAVKVETRPPTAAPRRKPRNSGLWWSVIIGAVIGCALLSAVTTGAVVIGQRFLGGEAADTPETPAAQPSASSPVGALQTEIAADDRNSDSLATLEALRGTPTPTLGGSGQIVYSSIVANGAQITQHLFRRALGDSSTATQLTSGTSQNSAPAVSPDGSRVAFVSDSGGDSDLYVLDLTQGGEPRRILDTPHDEFTPAWSLDGQSVVFASDMYGNGALAILQVGIDGLGAVNLIYSKPDQRAFRPTFNRDGTRLAFVLGNPSDARTWEIVSLDLLTGTLTTISDNAVMDNWPVFGADGRTVYGIRTEGDAATVWRSTGGQPPEALYSAPQWLSGLAVSPDGAYLLFNEGSSSTATGQFRVLSLSDATSQLLDIIAGVSADWAQ
jgi:serine/threonine protein kinase